MHRHTSRTPKASSIPATVKWWSHWCGVRQLKGQQEDSPEWRNAGDPGGRTVLISAAIKTNGEHHEYCTDF
jgi:hypothetical protein